MVPSSYWWVLCIWAWPTEAAERAAFNGSLLSNFCVGGGTPRHRARRSHHSLGGCNTGVGKLTAKRSSNTDEMIDFQADSSQFGRGEMHLSALLQEGDVVAYQTGSWFVDGVQVGVKDPSLAYCQIETIQVVWTHNCEHGVLRGMELVLRDEDDDESKSRKNLLKATGDVTEFGPEQLIARFPVVWEGMNCVPFVELDEENWLIR